MASPIDEAVISSHQSAPGRARLLAGRIATRMDEAAIFHGRIDSGGLIASPIAAMLIPPGTARPARSRALPHAVSEKSVLSSVVSFARSFFARSLREIKGGPVGLASLRSIGGAFPLIWAVARLQRKAPPTEEDRVAPLQRNKKPPSHLRS